MKRGKASEAVLDRSVLRQLHSENPHVLQGPAYGVSWGSLDAGEGAVVCTSLCDVYSGSCPGAFPLWQKMAVAQAANDLAAARAVPAVLSVQLLLPEDMEETLLKQWMRNLDQICAEWNVQIISGHTEITPGVKRPIMTGTLFGRQKASPGMFRPGLDLVMTGYAGLAGTAAIVAVRENELLNRYPLSFLERVKTVESSLDAGAVMEKAWAEGACAAYALSGSGVLGGLWELAEGAGIGLEIGWKRIPIRQETVEISEFCGLNPYCLHSGGGMVIGAENGQELADRLRDARIPAAVIGRTTEGNDRILRNGDDVSFLNRPVPDELLKVIEA